VEAGYFRRWFGNFFAQVNGVDLRVTHNQNFVPGGSWLAPTSVVTPRFVA
jgi:hypothetical protein